MKAYISLPLLALALSSATSGSPPPSAENACRMPLPKVEILEDFRGAVSAPFILKADRDKEISILSMNIQNIPFANYQNPDYRDDRQDCLTELAGSFDAAAFQEDFLPRENISSSTWSPVFLTNEYLKTGSPGLSFQSRFSFSRAAAQGFTPDTCSGLLDRSNDCLATKGFQIVEINGIRIINTHLDAGRAESDHMARQNQMVELSDSLPVDGPLLVLGDFNFHVGSQTDQTILNDFIRRNNLTVYARYSAEKGHDFVMGRGIDVNWIGKVENLILSDHAGLVVNLSLPNPSPTL